MPRKPPKKVEPSLMFVQASKARCRDCNGDKFSIIMTVAPLPCSYCQCKSGHIGLFYACEPCSLLICSSCAEVATIEYLAANHNPLDKSN